METLDLGNNETISSGITKENDGTFTAMTYTKSKNFKTLKGAQKWYTTRLMKSDTDLFNEFDVFCLG